MGEIDSSDISGRHFIFIMVIPGGCYYNLGLYLAHDLNWRTIRVYDGYRCTYYSGGGEVTFDAFI